MLPGRAQSIQKIFSPFILKRLITSAACKSKARLDNKTVLITGANTGIGKETARDLAGRGARVLLACRNVTKAEAAASDIIDTTGNTNIEVYELDLASLKSVRDCAENVLEKENRLDVLVNNAGVFATPQWTTKDGFEMQMGTNHLGHFLLTNLLLDLIKKSAPSRIVILSSESHRGGKLDLDDINLKKNYTPFQAYSNSKLANNLFCRELHRRLQGTGVTANSVHPGVIDTEIPRHILKDQGLLYSTVTSSLLFLFRPLIKTPVQGAQTTIYVAVAEELESMSGKYFSECALATEAPPARDTEMAAKLWTLSEKLVGLTDTPLSYGHCPRKWLD